MYWLQEHKVQPYNTINQHSEKVLAHRTILSAPHILLTTVFKVFQSFSESGRLAKDFIFKTEKCILVSTNSACGSPLTRHSWHAYFSAAGRVNINIHYNLRLELSLSGLHIPLRLKYLPLFRETISQPLQYTIADCNWRLVASWCSVDRYYDDCDS